jgi:hypothetical protein
MMSDSTESHLTSHHRESKTSFFSRAFPISKLTVHPFPEFILCTHMSHTPHPIPRELTNVVALGAKFL